MQRYLHIRSGRYQLIVPADGVREVLDLSEAEDAPSEDLHGCALWRGTSIRQINLHDVLTSGGFSSARPLSALIYGEDEAEPPVMVLCDEVVGLIQAEETSFRQLPFHEDSLDKYFDSVLPDAATGRMLLRLSGIRQSEADSTE